jgi:hypothetical protein
METITIEPNNESKKIDLINAKKVVIESFKMVGKFSEPDIIFINKNNILICSEPLQVNSYDVLDNYYKVYFKNLSMNSIEITYYIIMKKDDEIIILPESKTTG